MEYRITAQLLTISPQSKGFGGPLRFFYKYFPPLNFSYSIDKLTAQKVFSVTLNIGLCIDGTCTLTPVLDHVWVPVPLCNTSATSFTLPGDGTVAGFVQELGDHIGTSAIELILEKYGLDVSVLRFRWPFGF